MFRRISQLLIALAFLPVVALPFPAAADNGLTSKVIAPDFVIAGRTYGEWTAAWWQWAPSIPVSSHPLFDKGSCTTGQTGEVFFLGGKFCSTGDSSCNASTANRSMHCAAQEKSFLSNREFSGFTPSAGYDQSIFVRPSRASSTEPQNLRSTSMGSPSKTCARSGYNLPCSTSLSPMTICSRR